MGPPAFPEVYVLEQQDDSKASSPQTGSLKTTFKPFCFLFYGLQALNAENTFHFLSPRFFSPPNYHIFNPRPTCISIAMQAISGFVSLSFHFFGGGFFPFFFHFFLFLLKKSDNK